jgi:hypothetical protein
MKIAVNGTDYRCTGRPSLCDPIRFNLPDGQPDPATLGGTIRLLANDGFELATVNVAEYAWAYIDGTSLVLTNAPEPEPVEPEEPEPQPDPITTLQLAVAELAGAVEQEILITKLAVAELAEVILGGES